MDIEIISTARKQDDRIDYAVLIFVTRGADVFDTGIGDQLWVFLKTLIEGGATKIVVDMEGLAFIDSFGIGVLINCAKFVRQKGGDLVLYRVPGNIGRIFEPLRLNRFIRFFQDMGEIQRFYRLL